MTAPNHDAATTSYRRPLWIRVEMLRERLAILLAPWAIYEDVREAHRGK